MLREAEVVVLGAGVAGLTLARLLLERGRKVLVVAEALGEASRPPVALVNPLRGRRFTLAEEGERALAAALAFYGRFVPLHLGVFRPVPEADRPKVAGRLSRLKHRWEKEGVLLEEAFWLEPRPLLARLAEGLPGAAFGKTLPQDLRPPLPELPPEEAPLGVSWALFAVAETGSVALSSEDGRKAHLLPPTHLVFVEANRVYGTLLEALHDLPTLPRALGLHSGPSKSADIGQVMVTGVHGPGRLVVVVLE